MNASTRTAELEYRASTAQWHAERRASRLLVPLDDEARELYDDITNYIRHGYDLARLIDDENDPDLFWAIRGGGGNFGVVTSFEYRLFPLGPDVMMCFVLYPRSAGREVLRALERYMADAPEEVSPLAFLGRVPEADDFPPESHGEPYAAILCIYAGDADEGAEVLRPLRELGHDVASHRVGQHLELCRELVGLGLGQRRGQDGLAAGGDGLHAPARYPTIRRPSMCARQPRWRRSVKRPGIGKLLHHLDLVLFRVRPVGQRQGAAVPAAPAGEGEQELLVLRVRHALVPAGAVDLHLRGRVGLAALPAEQQPAYVAFGVSPEMFSATGQSGKVYTTREVLDTIHRASEEIQAALPPVGSETAFAGRDTYENRKQYNVKRNKAIEKVFAIAQDLCFPDMMKEWEKQAKEQKGKPQKGGGGPGLKVKGKTRPIPGGAPLPGNPQAGQGPGKAGPAPRATTS